MTVKYPTGRNIVKTPEYIQSMSFDPDFEVSTVEILGYDPDAGTLNRVKVNADGELVANLETADIEIGAVEIKDATSDTRAVVDSDGLNVSVKKSALPSGAATSALQTTGNTLLGGIAGFVPSAYDYISLSYTGTNLTGVVFKTGGSGGTTVATLTLAYTGSDLVSVTKT